MGQNVDSNSESIPFLRLNEAIFNACGAKWNSIEKLPERLEFYGMKISTLIKSNLTNESFKKDYLKGSKFLSLDEPAFYGWKDPRNSFTISLFKEIFPNARIIHIHRNPIDVALSLCQRELKLEKATRLNWIYQTKKLLRKKNSIIINRAPELKNITYGFNLWCKYVERCLLETNAYHVSYESLLTSSKLEVDKLMEYVGYDPPERLLKLAIQELDENKKYGFVNNAAGVQLYRNVNKHDLVRRLDYDNII